MKKAQEEAIAFIKTCIPEVAVPIQEYSFLELAQPTIEEAFISCIQKGATKIIAVPVLLLTAGHAKEDIPNELARIQALYPDVELEYGEPLGVHPYMIDLLAERLEETGESLAEDSMVLLVGRGSSDPDVKRDLAAIAEQLKVKKRLKRVDFCFMAAAAPNLEEGLQKARASGCRKVFVIPYILFTGILMKKLARTIAELETNNGQRMFLCNYLGYHPNVKRVLQQRITEASIKAATVK